MASYPQVPSVNTAVTAVAATVGTPVPALGVRRVRLECTQDCYVTIANPVVTATSANGLLLRAPTYGQEFGVRPGDRISVIRVAADGILSVTFLEDA